MTRLIYQHLAKGSETHNSSSNHTKPKQYKYKQIPIGDWWKSISTVLAPIIRTITITRTNKNKSTWDRSSYLSEHLVSKSNNIPPLTQEGKMLKRLLP